MNQQSRKTTVITALFIWALFLGVIKYAGVITTESRENLWWTGLLLLGAMITGFLFQPMAKDLFPKGNDPRLLENPGLKLKDHETLMGYYPLVALIVGLGGILISPLLFGRQVTFEIKSVHFWWATVGSGVLNVFIFYLFTKALRYGDVSLVSTTQSLVPIISLPLSYLAFALVGSGSGITSPTVSTLGFIGIVITVIAIAANGFLAKKKTPEGAPEGDWFAHHPVLTGAISTVIAGVAVNFDKVAVDAGNPFLHGIIVPFVVFLICMGWTLAEGGWERVSFVFRNYRRTFLLMGIVYAAIILIMNTTLYGHNVNYYLAIKRVSVVFGAFYGIYVLREGGTPQEKFVRILTAMTVILGLFLITLKG